MEQINEEVPEEDPLPNPKTIGEIVMYGIAERDDFIDGLSLGIWDEEFGYYKPKEVDNE